MNKNSEPILDPTTTPPTVVVPAAGVIQPTNIADLRNACNRYRAALHIYEKIEPTNKRKGRVDYWRAEVARLRGYVEEPPTPRQNRMLVCGVCGKPAADADPATCPDIACGAATRWAFID